MLVEEEKRVSRIELIMQCQICNNNDATIHLTEIADGVRTEMHICEHCAAEQDIAVKSHIPINELLSSLLAVQPTDDELSGPSEQKLACPNCGFTLAQFRKEGVLGCPHDYEVFEKSLLPLIQKAHNGKTTHCGKLPSKTPQDTKKQIELLNLRQQLEAAVQSEDYELAAELRDKINQAEK
jgi:protein arginine kinase activator